MRLKLNPIGSNMTEIENRYFTILFSYKTPVAAHEEGKGFYKTIHYYSATTTRHINKWLKDNGASDNVKIMPQTFFDGLL